MHSPIESAQPQNPLQVAHMEPCSEQKHLSNTLVEAVRKSYQSKQSLDAAKEKSLPILDLAVALSEARLAERKAVKALNDHKKNHGCA